MWIPFLGHVTGTNSVAFNVVPETQSLQGKTILITGGDSGIGLQAVSYLAQLSPAVIWLAVENLDNAKDAVTKLEQLAPSVQVRTVQLNLASFASIRATASLLVTQIDRLDLLFLHAGVMGLPAQLTKDGYEYQFGINHLGHALLTKLLLPILLRTAEQGGDVRVVFTTSISHHNAPDGGIDFSTLKTDGTDLPTLKRYAQSKLANILYARALADQYPQLKAVAVHPGACRTKLYLDSTGGSLFDRVLAGFLHQPVEVVAKHLVWAAMTEDLESGGYYEPLGIKQQGRPETKDKDLIAKLWDWTEEELKPHVS